MNRTPPGAALGDRSVYVGRQLLGTIRSTTGGVVAFDANGKIVGTFQNQKGAMAALNGPTKTEERAS